MPETRPSGAGKASFWRNFATPCATFNQNSTKRCFDSVVEQCFDSVVEQCSASVLERCLDCVAERYSVGVAERCLDCVPQMVLGQCG